MPVFIKRKPVSHPGLQGATPWHVFAFFLRAKKEGGPQARPEKDEHCGLSAHKNAVLLKRRSVARPRPFSAWRKDAKRRLGGAPLSTPDGRPVFFSGKPAGTASPEPTPIQQGGPGPPGLDWARGRKKTATPSPGAATPFCIEAGSGVGVRVDFHRENPGLSPERLNRRALGPVTRHCGVPQWP